MLDAKVGKMPNSRLRIEKFVFFRWDKMLVDVDVIRDAIRNKRIEFGRIQM